ncbi:MAG: hypothetical protein Q7S83_01465 [bacterium]|nr:hypothetical protein [bacterium]
MREAKTPQGDIPSLYSLAANTLYDEKTRREFSDQLVELYKDYILTAVSNLQEQHGTKLDSADLFNDGVVGLLESLRSLELNADCPTYADWIGKNIRKAIECRILEEIRMSGGGEAPRG